MATTTDLIATLSDALGVPRRMVEATARHLREDGLLPAGTGGTAPPVLLEHGVALLLGIMLAPCSKAAPDLARLYAQLPFDRVELYRPLDDGRSEMIRVDETDPVFDDIAALGDTFGRVLAKAIDDLRDPGCNLTEPGQITVGGGLGTARAAVALHGVGHASHLAYLISFTLAPLGGGVQPDDAPRARLDREAIVPGAILPILSELFSDSENARLPATRAQQIELEK